MMQEKDFLSMAYRLNITQLAKYGEPKKLSVKELWETYGNILFEGLTPKERQTLVLKILEEGYEK